MEVNIDDMKLGDWKRIAAMFAETHKMSATQLVAMPHPATQPHPFIGRYVVVRTYSAGVHVGTLAAASGKEVMLTDSRRIYSWNGAFTLSAVATTGITGGKMACELPELAITEAIEIIPCSDNAKDNLKKFPVHTP